MRRGRRLTPSGFATPVLSFLQVIRSALDCWLFVQDLRSSQIETEAQVITHAKNEFADFRRVDMRRRLMLEDQFHQLPVDPRILFTAREPVRICRDQRPILRAAKLVANPKQLLQIAMRDRRVWFPLREMVQIAEMLQRLADGRGQFQRVVFPPPQDYVPGILEALLDLVVKDAAQTEIDAPVLTNVVEDEPIIVGFEKVSSNRM